MLLDAKRLVRLAGVGKTIEYLTVLGYAVDADRDRMLPKVQSMSLG